MTDTKELPPISQMPKALEIAGGSAEAAKYLCVQFEKKVFALKLDKLDNPELANNAKLLQGQLNAFAKYVACQLSDDPNVWPGKAAAITTAFEKLQASLATEGAKSIESNAKENEYTMHIALGNDGEVLRAYTSENIDHAVTTVFDPEQEAAQQQTQGL